MEENVFIPYSDVESHKPYEFHHGTVNIGSIVLVHLDGKTYKAAYIMPKLGGIIVNILEEFIAV